MDLYIYGGLDLYNVGRQKVTNFKHTKGAPSFLAGE